jgi:hypothetical protein
VANINPSISIETQKQIKLTSQPQQLTASLSTTASFLTGYDHSELSAEITVANRKAMKKMV